jgi:hypothetical protein
MGFGPWGWFDHPYEQPSIFFLWVWALGGGSTTPVAWPLLRAKTHQTFFFSFFFFKMGVAGHTHGGQATPLLLLLLFLINF